MQTIDSLYLDQEFIETPGVQEGLLEGAVASDKNYYIEDNGNGTESVFYFTDSGTPFYLGDRDNMPMAGNLGGAEPEALPMEAPAGSESVTPAEFGMDVANFGKGLATGFLGLPGDIAAIANGLYEIGARGGDVSRTQAFLAGLQEGTFLPTTESINKWVDENIPLPDRMKTVQPEGTPDTMVRGVVDPQAQSPISAEGTAAPYIGNVTGTMGELVAPGGLATLAAKGIAKGGKVVGKALVDEAAKQVENMLDKQGLILKFGPDSKVQIPTAPKIETPQFNEWFGGSKVLDAESKPLLMYHGTNKGGDEGLDFFDTYSGRHGLFGQGSYFTDNADVASSYTKKGKGQNPAVYPVYLSIKNPIDMDAAADPNVWLKAFPDGLDYFPESGSNEKFYRAMEEFYMDEGYSAAEAPGAMMETLMEMGFDGITHIGGGRVAQDGVKHRVYIAFEPEQVKSVFNKGTFDPSDSRILNSAAGGSVASGAGSATMDKEQKAK